MIAPDTSVVVAGFASWHEGHAASRRALRPGARLPAHVVVETYSVLTRLPPPHRAPAEVVVAFLERSFPEPLLTLSAGAHRRLITDVCSAGIVGGGVYDALIAATVRDAGATLLTRDRQAIPIYEEMGADFELLE